MSLAFLTSLETPLTSYWQVYPCLYGIGKIATKVLRRSEKDMRLKIQKYMSHGFFAPILNKHEYPISTGWITYNAGLKWKVCEKGNC